jgi:hypothetical protein
MNEPESKGHEEETNRHNGDTNGQELVQKVSTAPSKQTTATPETEPSNQHKPSTSSKVLEATLYWLHHYWDAPREKSKKTEIFMAVLTLAIAIAAFWSACIFQGQLTEARRATQRSNEAFRIDERAWIEIQPITPILKSPASNGFGALFTYNIFPKNVGKTAAYDITVKAVRGAPMSGLSLGDNADDIARNQKMLLNNTLGMPDVLISRRVSKTLGPTEVSNAPFDIYGQEPQIFKNGTIYQFLIGRVDYADAFRVQHWMTFCLFIADSKGNLQYCQYGNDEDRNPEFPPN